MDFEKLKETTTEALIDLIGKESKSIAEDVDELKVIAGRLVEYWKRALDGDETADRMIRHLKVQARLLVEIHHVEARRGLATTVEKILDAVAAAGLALLRAGIKAVL